MIKDPYQVLGVHRTATHEEVVKAYRTLATKWHPDKNLDNVKEAVSRFKEISAAFETLGDKDKRKNYDFYGTNQFPSFSFRSRNTVDDVFDNIFSQVFGDQRSFSEHKSRIKITLKEAYFGCLKKIVVEKKGMCEVCKGTGSSRWDPCLKCDRKGFVFVSEGAFRVQTTCVHCQGKGSVPIEGCHSCLGKGYNVTESKEAEIRIPPGAVDGLQIRSSVNEQDIFVVVNIEKDERFERHDKVLIGSTEIPYHKLVLGGESEFDIFGKKVVIKIPPRLKAGSRIRIKGEGMPAIQNSNVRGDLFIDVKLKMPDDLTKEHEKIIARLAKIYRE